MHYIPYEDQLRIKRRMKRLPEFMKSEPAKILAFETVSTLILAYGACISIYKHPIIENKPDPACDIYIACFYYFALSVAAPFTGGHLNPSTTIAFNFLKKNKNMLYYFIAQFLGAILAALLAFWFFKVTPAPYTVQESFARCIADTFGEAVGLFIVIFMALIVVETKYASSEYFGYLSISLMVFMGRAFTFSRGCINPALGTVFQVLWAIRQQNAKLVLYSLPVIIGPTVGAITAYFVFAKFYKFILLEVKEAEQSQKQQNF